MFLGLHACALPSLQPTHVWHLACPQRRTPGIHQQSVAWGWISGPSSSFFKPLGLCFNYKTKPECPMKPRDNLDSTLGKTNRSNPNTGS